MVGILFVETSRFPAGQPLSSGATRFARARLFIYSTPEFPAFRGHALFRRANALLKNQLQNSTGKALSSSRFEGTLMKLPVLGGTFAIETVLVGF